MKNKIKILIASTLIINGCATLIDGKEQTIVLNSSPEGATVVVGGVTLGKTPLTAPVKRSNSNQGVRFTLDGYETLEVPLLSEFNAIALINHPLGTTTDVVTGAAYKYSPGAYIVTLKPAKGSSAEFSDNEKKLFDFILKNYNEVSKEAFGKNGENITAISQLSKNKSRDTVVSNLKNAIMNNEAPPQAARAYIKLDNQ